MKQWLFTLGILISLSVDLGWSQNHGFGMGVILGDPTGISFKNWTNDNHAIDAALAWSFRDEASIHLHGDYLFHKFRGIRMEKGTLPFYYGIGARIKFEDDNLLGIRFPVGLNVYLVELPLDFFVEIVPIMNIVPETELDLNIAIGCRYFF